jgi:hypothetical protein
MEKELNTYTHWVHLHLDKDNADKFFANMASQRPVLDPSGEVLEDEFIYSAFLWEKSNEGHDYWQNIQEKLEQDNGWVVI